MLQNSTSYAVIILEASFYFLTTSGCALPLRKAESEKCTQCVCVYFYLTREGWRVDMHRAVRGGSQEMQSIFRLWLIFSNPLCTPAAEPSGSIGSCQCADSLLKLIPTLNYWTQIGIKGWLCRKPSHVPTVITVGALQHQRCCQCVLFLSIRRTWLSVTEAPSWSWIRNVSACEKYPIRKKTVKINSNM